MMATFFYSMFLFLLAAISTNIVIKAKVLRMFGMKVMVAWIGGSGPQLQKFIVPEAVTTGSKFEVEVNGDKMSFTSTKKFIRTELGVPMGLYDSDHCIQIPWSALTDEEHNAMFSPVLYDSIITDAMDLAETTAQALAKKKNWAQDNAPILSLVGIIILIVLAWQGNQQNSLMLSNQIYLQGLIEGVNQTVAKSLTTLPVIPTSG